MAVIYMKHPTHGTKVAVSEMEAKADEKHGWLRYNDLEIREAVFENKLIPAPKRKKGE